MSDAGEVWKPHRAARREKRASNRNASADILRAHGVDFQVRNGGAHLVVRHASKIADLWPGTGKYQMRGDGRFRRGVFNLLHELGVNSDRD